MSLKLDTIRCSNAESFKDYKFSDNTPFTNKIKYVVYGTLDEIMEIYNAFDNQLFYIACQCGRLDICKWQYSVNPSCLHTRTNYNYPSDVATQFGNIEIIEWMFECDNKIIDRLCSMLNSGYHDFMFKHETIVKFLRDKEQLNNISKNPESINDLDAKRKDIVKLIQSDPKNIDKLLTFLENKFNLSVEIFLK